MGVGTHRSNDGGWCVQRVKYLGIDESNHGRWPEFFVGVYSSHELDVKERSSKGKGRLGKQHRRFDLYSGIGDRSFSFVQVPWDIGEIYRSHGEKSLMIAVASEMIKARDGLEQVLIDGEFPQSAVEALARTLHPTPLPEVTMRRKADITYPLVNYADAIAHQLFRAFTRSGETDFEACRIAVPHPERYRGLLDSFGRTRHPSKFYKGERPSATQNLT